MAYFEDNSAAMVQLETMVDAVGVRNVVYALASICGMKAQHLAMNWQDEKTARAWDRCSEALRLFAQNRCPPTPLDR